MLRVRQAAALLDVLRSFGLDEEARSAAVRAGVEFLLRAQRADGSWPSSTQTSQVTSHVPCMSLRSPERVGGESIGDHKTTAEAVAPLPPVPHPPHLPSPPTPHHP